MDTWAVWELVLPLLERDHDVLAPGSYSTASATARNSTSPSGPQS